MYKRIDKKKRNKWMMELLNEQLFCNMFSTLQCIEKEYADLSPAEVWNEARVTLPIFAQAIRPDLSIGILKEELKERYDSFWDNETETIRNDEDIERSVFLVLMVMMYMLVSSAETTSDNVYRKHCEALASETKDHPLLEKFWLEVRDTENKEEQLGRKVGVVHYLLEKDGLDMNSKEEQQQVMAELVNCTLNCSTSTIEKQIAVVGMVNRKHGGLFDKHLEVLEQGLKDKNEGRVVKEFHIEKSEFNDTTFGTMYDIHDNKNVHT